VVRTEGQSVLIFYIDIFIFGFLMALNFLCLSFDLNHWFQHCFVPRSVVSWLILDVA